jgi:serine/threonine protein kinase
MVLEWLEGCSLALDLKTRREQKLRGRSLEEMVSLFDPGARALEYAHQQGVVHRDVKPGNLFLVDSKKTGRPRMKVLDFGLAKILDETIGITMAATVGSFMMCSPRYAAPEQFDPKLGAIGPWTDVYSLALVLLEVLRDQKVRKADGFTASMIEAIDPKVDLSARALGMQLPPRIEAALARAVSIDTKVRQRSAGELWDEIRAVLRPQISVPPPPDPTPAPEPAVAPTPVPPPRSAPGDDFERSPESLASLTLRDPVHDVPFTEENIGGTVVMNNAPRRPGAPPKSERNEWVEGGTQVVARLRPLPPSQPIAAPAPFVMQVFPPASQPRPPSSARASSSRAPIVILVLFVLAALGAGGFLAWRAWKASHAAAIVSPPP